MKEISKKLIKCFKSDGKVLTVGCGGSAAQAQHLAAELMGKFEHWRQPLPAIALTTDTSFLTAWANDSSFDTVFSRQVLALGQKGDVLIAFSTSGKSESVLRAITTAETLGMDVINFPRKGNSTAHIQEYQLKLMHDV